MKKYLIIAGLCATGCMSSMTNNITSVTREYETIFFRDGINLEEAKVIGQRALVKENLVKTYDLMNPELFTDVYDLPNHEKYWFISFEERKAANIQLIFMAIIDKKTGRVKFADDLKEEKRWILEAVLLGG